ncbi:hypothetical protein AZE42_01923 [Rhizopogon vesiculosus]|uniref:SHSP domain-containing protein n=1 Tax=Rhizopogon vesiculosus TaxID=180088 RepID=A0A1J8QIA0_9AGAM|nr:hypothetical protein AZE42_01923 [Rhizopogon vesiculosus]
MSYQYPYTPGNLSMTPTPPTPYAWDTVELNNDLPEQLEHHQPAQHVLNPQHQPQKEVYSTSPRLIELQEHVPIVPSQRARSEVPHHLHHVLSPPGTSTRAASIMSQDVVQRPHIHVDTTRHMAASGSPPSGPPSAGGVHSVGPVRARVSPAHNMAAHPYRRTHSANPRRDSESNLPVRQPSSSYAAGPSQLPSSAQPTESRVSTALFELPGVKKTDLKIELSTCQNGVKQLSITGEARKPLADGIVALKERKYGKFRRVLPKEDISVILEDGVLTLRIQFGPPLESEQESEMIPIP